MLCPVTYDERAENFRRATQYEFPLGAGWPSAGAAGSRPSGAGRGRAGLVVGCPAAGGSALAAADGCDPCSAAGSSTLNFKVGQLPSASKQALSMWRRKFERIQSRKKRFGTPMVKARGSRRNHVPVPNHSSYRSFPTLSASVARRADTISISSLVTSIHPGAHPLRFNPTFVV